MKSKQTGRSKQTAELLKSFEFSFQTTLHCVSEALSVIIAKSKQTAECKQTAELIKNSKFSFQTSLLWALSALEVSKWLFWGSVNNQLKVNKQLNPSKLLNFNSKHLCFGHYQY